MDRPTISVILPTYNRSEMLGGALETLVCQETGGEFSYEVVVIDNASTDATRQTIDDIAARSSVRVHYCYQQTPGPAAARNLGVERAQGKWLAFLDDDELATPDWLLQLHRAAVQTGSSVVGGAMHLDLPPEVLKGLSKFVRATSLREIDYYPTIRPYDEKRLPGTNNALVARSVFEEVGDFDASVQCGGSDSDFFLRARTAGVMLYYTPHAVVRHRVAPNRLTTEYFRWDAKQGCGAFASLDYEYKGAFTLAVLCTARIAHAMLIVVPRLGWAWLKRDSAEVLGQRVRLWRAEGYLRRTLALLAPRWFPQKRYFDALNFRQGRTVGQQTIQAETVP